MIVYATIIFFISCTLTLPEAHVFHYVVFSVTGTLSFLTLNSPSTVSRGDDNYGGSVSIGGTFEFGNGYISSVYVSTVHAKGYMCTRTSIRCCKV